MSDPYQKQRENGLKLWLVILSIQVVTLMVFIFFFPEAIVNWFDLRTY